MLGSRAKRLRPLVIAGSLFLAACGVSSSELPAFIEGILGSGGGTLEAHGVRVDVPAGAFSDEIVCVIVPGPDGLPTDPKEGTIQLLPNCKCVGPRGQLLAVPGTLTFCYDLSEIPPQVPEGNLLLLEFDEAAGWLDVVPATQDLATHCFEDVNYDEFGYVVLGYRIGLIPTVDYVVPGSSLPPAAFAPQGRVIPTAGLALADAQAILPPTILPGTDNAIDYIPSADGSRILFTRQSLVLDVPPALFTVDTADPFDSRLVLPEGTFTTGDALFGWLGNQDAVFHTHQSALALGLTPQGLGQTFFSYKAGDGTGSVVDLINKPSFNFLDDVRVSPDRTKVMLRWVEFGQVALYTTDIIDIDGNLLVTGVAQGSFNGRPSPRWMPDSSGIYYVETDGVTVTELALRPNDVDFPDGYESLTLYHLTVPESNLIAFLVGPNFGPNPEDQRCAFVRRDASVLPQAVGFATDFYDTDTLAGTDHTTLSLENEVVVEEIVASFAIGSFQTAIVLVQAHLEQPPAATLAAVPPVPDSHTLVFDLTASVLLADIPAPISNIDISREVDSAGQALVWIQQTDPAYPEFPKPGIYRLDTLFGNPVDVTPPGITLFGPPRWLHTWRTTPGLSSYFPRAR